MACLLASSLAIEFFWPGELGLDGRHALFGPLPLADDGGELLRVAEELGRLLVVHSGHLLDERRLVEDGGRVAGGEQPEHRRLAGVHVVRHRDLHELGASRVEVRLRLRGFLVHLGQPGLRGRQLLAGLVVLLADVVHLGLQAVHLRLDLADGRLWGCAGRSAVDGDPARDGEQRREHGTAAQAGSRSDCPGGVYAHVRVTPF